MRLTKLKIDAESSMGAGGGEGIQRVALSIVVYMLIVVVCDVIRLTSWRRTLGGLRWMSAATVGCEMAYLVALVTVAGNSVCWTGRVTGKMSSSTTITALLRFY